ncbi:MAG: SPFH domain-containing protein [Coriobacteriia bacterium]|nr:SPFH domain-containing protein [Coriobacteriia bacterium]
MGIFDAAFDSIGGMFQDQWKDIVTAGPFDELTLVAPGIRKQSQNGRGANYGSNDVLSNGSQIFVPENTAAFVLSSGGIETVITEPGSYVYQNGELSVFNQQDRQTAGIVHILISNTVERFGYSGMSPQEKRVAFINLREVRGIKFGTRGPLVYHDGFYGADLEVFGFGSLAIRVTDPVKLVQQFIPANTYRYSLKKPKEREQLVTEFLHSFIQAVNQLSAEYRISQLPGLTNEIAQVIATEKKNAGTWPERYGLALASVAIENIELSDESRELIRGYAEKKMSVAAYEGVSEHAANVAAQQTIAQGVLKHGLGEGGGMLFGMNLAQGMNPVNASQAKPAEATMAGEGFGPAQHSDSTNQQEPAHAQSKQTKQSSENSADSFDDKVETLKKLKDLLDMGILSQEEFDAKKRDILGL